MARRRVFWGVALPVLLSLGVTTLAHFVFHAASVRWGIELGLTLALLQSLLSMGAMAWAWEKKFFYWVWGGGVFLRMLVFTGTAFFIYRYTGIPLMSVLLPLVVATMVFLVTEALLFFGNKNELS